MALSMHLRMSMSARGSLSLLLVSGALAGAVFACSGSSATEIPEPVTDRGATEPSVSTPSTEAESAPPPSNDPNLGESPSPPAAPAAPPAAPSPPPAPACLTEVEPNDAPDRATIFTSCISGKLATDKDTDVFRITAPANASSMVVDHAEPNGKVLYRVSRDGGVPILGTTVFTDGAAKIGVSPGATYVFRLSAANGGAKNAARPYELRVTFE